MARLIQDCVPQGSPMCMAAVSERIASTCVVVCGEHGDVTRRR